MTSSMLFSCISCPSHQKSVLSDIPKDLLEEVSRTKIVNTYKKGQTIFYEGNRPYGVYCMTMGKVKISKYAPEGKEYIVKIAKGGDLIGYRAFFTNELYTSTAEVIEEATICFLDKEKFFDILKRNPEFSLKLLAMMGNDIKCAEENSRNLAYKSSQERVVELLLTLNQTYGIQEEDGTYKIDILLSRDDLASMLGSTTETAVRLLTWLKEKGLIEMKKKYTYIKDLPALEEMLPDF